MSLHGLSRTCKKLYEVINYYLNMDPKRKLVQQKKRKYSTDKLLRAREKVHKLLQLDYIGEVYYPDWLSNVMMVKKLNGKWRMCMDFTDLNKACPKDCFPLSSIDRMMDTSSGHQVLTFMDIFSGFN